ncbi:hypothetical protein ACIQH9_11295 [Pseudarthrobacter oxydans]|uniref:hypothetical protein n=1 Tax=Pseudarthrobacter oxydans TaxID=1671 RepID=UPI00381B687D
MSGPGSRPGSAGGLQRILAVLFTVAAVGSLLLVAVDLLVGRPAAGDVFIAVLNGVVAVVLWRRLSERARV